MWKQFVVACALIAVGRSVVTESIATQAIPKMKVRLFGGPGDGAEVEVSEKATALTYPHVIPGAPREIHWYRKTFTKWEHSKGCEECKRI